MSCRRFHDLFAFRLLALAVAAVAVPACGGGGGGGAPGFHVSTPSLPNAASGTAYSQTLQAAYGTVPFTWSILAGALPAGLSLDPGTGVISGTPAGNGVSSFTVRATDALNNTGQTTLSILVAGGAPGVLAVTTTSLPDASQNYSYGIGLSASNGTPPYTWSLSSGTLPAGLSLNPSLGTLTGAPSAPGVSNFTVGVADAAGVPQTDTQALSITVNAAPSITTTTLPASTKDIAYNQSAAAAGGVPPYAWSVAGGTLPPGLALDPATGAVSGTATTAGNYGFTLRAADQIGAAVTRGLSILINPPIVVNPLALPTWSMNHPFPARTFTATGGTGALAWAVSSGAIPPGMSLSSGGVLDGTPTVSGPFNFTVTATDTVGATGDLVRALTINPAPAITTLTLPDWTQSRPYAQTPAATGGTGALAWSLAAGSLPAGLTLSAATGALSGTPTTVGLSNFTLRITDTLGAVDTQVYAVTINSAPVVTTASLSGATQNQAYTQANLATSNGTAPFSWSVITGTLPAGLALSAGGVWSGTPTNLGTSNFTVRVTDVAGATDDQALSIVVSVTPGVTTVTVPAWTINRSYSQNLAATGGTPSLTWDVSGGTLPNTITLSGAGVLSGTATETGTFNFTARVTDSQGAADTQDLSLVINAAPVISTTTLPAWTINRSYTQNLAVADGTAPFAWVVSAGAEPPGLALSGAGVLSGTPTGTGTSNFTVQVTDAAGAADTQDLSVTINAAPLVTTTTLAGATQGQAYTHTALAASNGTASLSWSVVTGTAPDGLTLTAATGVFVGSPTGTGTSNFTVRVTDAAGSTDDQDLSITVSAPPNITTLTVPAWTINRSYSQNLAATGGTPSVTWDVSGGTLPNTITLSGAGVLSGTATETGTFNFTARVTDAQGAVDTQALSLVINAAPTVSTTTLPAWTISQTYSQNLSVADGTAAFAWVVTAGGPPAGLTLSGAGVLSGTPTGTGTSNFTVQVTDAAGATDTQDLSVTINAAPVVTTTTLAGATQGQAYTHTALAASNGTASLSWSVVTGTAPDGLTLTAATGVFVGSPTGTGTSNFTVRVTDAAGSTDDQDLSITVSAAPNITTTTVPAWTINRSYTQNLAATGGTPSLTWDVSGGTLPNTITLSGAGVLSGTATETGTFNFTARVTDAQGAVDTQALSLVINTAPAVSTTTLPDWTQGIAYSQNLSVSNGTAPFTWAVISGAEPTGTALSGAGVLSGTPTGLGNFTFTVQVTDAAGAIDTQVLDVDINAAPAISTTTLPNWTQGVAYSQSLSVSNGTAPFTFSVTSPAPPTDVTLSAAGVLSGTPSAIGTFGFTVQVVDAAGAVDTQGYVVVINVPIAISTATLPDGSQGVAYSQTLGFTGGTGTPTWALVTGGLPSGLSLNPSTGAITGTATGAGTSNFTVQVTDAVGDSDSKALSITVVASVLTITTTSLPTATVNVYYHAQVAISGGVATYLWAVSSGTLPTGLNLDVNTGVISGTPTVQGGPVAFDIQVTDSSGTPQTDTQNYSVFVRAASASQGTMVVATRRLPDALVGVAYSQNIAVQNGMSPKTFSIDPVSVALPAGLSLSAAGTVSGTPAAGDVGQYTITVSVTDSLGLQARANVLIVVRAVAASLSITTASVPDGTQDVEYGPLHLVATGGEAPYHWSLDESTETPFGVALTRGGVLQGVPFAPGAYAFIARVRDSGSPVRQATKTFTMNVAAGSGFQLTTTTLPDATVNAAYGPVTLAHNNIDGPVTSWIAETSELEAAGLSFNPATGAIEGTPTATGLLRFIAGASNSGSPRRLAFREFKLRILPAGAFKISTEQLPDINIGEAYSQTLQTTGAAGTVTWSLDPAYDLPDNINFSSITGEISGTTTSYGGEDFYVFEANDGSTTTRAVVRLSVHAPDPKIGYAPELLINGQAVLTTATVGSFQTQTIELSDVDMDRFTLELRVDHAPPAGMTLDGARAKLSGTPTVAGRYELPFRIREIRDDGGEAQEVYLVAEDLAILEIVKETGFRVARRVLPAGREGSSYGSVSIYLEGAPDTTAYAFAVTSGALPVGLTLDADNGTLSGTPTRAGEYRFTIQVTQNGNTCSMAYETRVDPKLPFGLATDRLADAYRGTAYAEALTTYGAAGAVTYSDAGSPTTFASLGLALNPGSGAVTGAPLAALADGVYLVAVTATDGGTAATSTRAVRVLVEGRTIQFTRIVLGFDGIAVNSSVAAAGGTAPYTYALAAGEELPTGLSLSAVGVVSGTPTVVNTFAQAVVRVTDADGRTGYGRVSSIILSKDLPALGFAMGVDSGTIDGTVGSALVPANATITAQGGDGTYTYAQAPTPPSAASDVLPGGTVALTNAANTAQFTGTPGISGHFPYVIRVTDGLDATADVVVRLRIQYDTSANLAIMTERLVDGVPSSLYPATQVRYWSNSAMGALTFSLSGAPAGLSINASTGEVFGTSVLAAGSYYFNVTVAYVDFPLVTATGRMKLVIAP